jgi:GDP-L-fucose synthase
MKKILVTGSSGLVGTHLIEKLLNKGYEVIGVDFNPPVKTIDNQNFKFISFDLRNQTDVTLLFNDFKFDGVITAFGIKGSPVKALESPLDFLEPSIKVNTNIIDNCFKHNSWLVFMSSVGVYPTAETFVEDDMWKAMPSKNDWYPSWSKRIPELYLEAYKIQYKWDGWSIVRPANIFGEYDNFGEGSTVIASTIRKVYESDGEIEAWGDGTPTRDFIYAGDVADACVKCLENRLHITSNLGSGEDISIKRMIETVSKVSGKDIQIKWDTTKPNGDMKRKMDTTIQSEYDLLPKLGFEEGIKVTYEYYEKNR